LTDLIGPIERFAAMTTVCHYRLILAFAAVLGAGSALSTAAMAESLTEALTRAYGTNPQLQAERAGLRATDEGVSQALSGWRPKVTVTGETGVQRTDNQSSTSERNPQSLELEIAQPVFQGGRTIYGTRRAEANVKAGRAQLTSTEQDVLLAATRAYMNVVRDLAVLELNRTNETRLQRQLQAARDRFRVGEITRTDVAQAEARVARATADRIQAEGAVVNSRANYRSVVGDLPGTLTSPGPNLVTLPANEQEALAQAETANPNVLRAHHLAQAAQYTVNVIRGELLPDLKLSGTLSNEEDTTARGSQREVGAVTATLTIPLYQAGEVYSRLRAAKETRAQRLENLDDQRRTAQEAAASAWNNLQTARAAVRSFQAEVRSSSIALEGVQREALVGSRTVLDVLDAEQELLNAKVNLVRSERDEIVARFELKSAVGGLTAAELKLPVDPYDPTRNYSDVRDKWFGAGKPEK
jgi:outer membrane protein